MGDIQSNNHRFSFTDDTEFRRIEGLVDTSSLQVELQRNVSEVLLLPLSLHEFACDDANRVETSLRIGSGLDRVVDWHIIIGQDAHDESGPVLTGVHLSKDVLDGSIVASLISITEVYGRWGWGLDKAPRINTRVGEKLFEFHYRMMDVGFTEIVTCLAIRFEQNVSPRPKVAASMEFDVGHIPTTKSGDDRSLARAGISVLYCRWRENTGSDSDEA